jgi:serine/threonine-protein kinase
MKDGSVKVLDFGIARLLDPPASEETTNTGVMMGTPQYMPPEQARGKVKLVDARSDLFAVGAIAFAVLSGRHVHEAESPNESFLRAMTTPAPSLRSVVPGVSPRTALVVDRALAFEQDDRWQDARAMQAAVREALAEIDEDPASSIAFAPTQLSLGKVAPAVTRAPTPVVNDVSHARPRGGRVALVILSLGAGAAGASWVARSPLFGHVSTGGSASVVAPPPMSSAARTVALAIGDASLPDAAIDALGQDTDASANADADAEEEDDDGGDDEEVAFDAGRAAMAVGKAIGHATHKAAPPTVRKKHHKKPVKH